MVRAMATAVEDLRDTSGSVRALSAFVPAERGPDVAAPDHAHGPRPVRARPGDPVMNYLGDAQSYVVVFFHHCASTFQGTLAECATWCAP